ncbi:MAG: hypothetical protein ACRDRK_26980 [Pseudonocardia sp.]
MFTILITALVTLTAVGAAVVASTIAERRRRKWHDIARERRRKEESRVAQYHQRQVLELTSTP